MEITTQKEADKVKWELFDLERKIKELSEPLKKFNEEESLKNLKEKLENKTFHNPRGGGFVYVIEVSKYEVVGIEIKVFSGDYSLTLKKHGRNFSVNTYVSYKHSEFSTAAEWIGIGNSEYVYIEEITTLLKIFLTETNKSI